MVRRVRSARRVWRTVARALALPLGLVVLLAALPVAGARLPITGDSFEFDLNWYLDQGTGDYAGYSEELRSHYRYAVTATTPTSASVAGDGQWSWSASDGSRDGRTESFRFTFDLTSRKYTNGSDLDPGYVNPAIWFWIPTPVARGQSYEILNDWLGVVDLDSTKWVGFLPKKAVLLEVSGTYIRDDAYGRFDVTYHDRYWFDKETGYIVAEFFEETDTSASASFRLREEILVTASSYAVPLDLPPVLGLYGFLPALAVLGVALLVRRVRGPWTVPGTSGLGRVVVRRVRRARDLEGLTPDASRYFAAFLPVFARRAVGSGDPALVALSASRIVGLLTHDGESGVGSLFAADAGVARYLLKKLRTSDFFLEANGTSWDLTGVQAIDAFEILELADPQAVPFDASVVRPMGAHDLPAVQGIAEQVYLGRAGRWITSSFQDGDLAFVATVDGHIVGFAFATVAGTEARLHSLTVLPRYRARGLGTELMAARLSALSALGVRRAVVEISQHNAASLRVAYRAGFAPVGKSVHYARQAQTLALAFQRQF